MEDAMLGNSKGATYKSFILDVEIVIKKEGTANIAEGRVKNKNTREGKKDSPDPEKGDLSNRNLKQDVFLVSAGPTYLHETSNQPKMVDLSTEKSIISDLITSDLLTLHQDNVSNENNRTNSNPIKQQKCKHIVSNETNPSETSSEKHQKKKRSHKSAHSSRVFKGKVEPVDFLECNRIFMCNYLQLPRQNSDSALCCNYLGTLNKILQQEYIDNLDKTLKSTRSVGEIFSLLKSKNNIWNETTNTKLSSSTKDLGSIYSCGDCSTAHNYEIHRENFQKLYGIKNVFKTNSDAHKLSDSLAQTIKDDKPYRNLPNDLSVLKQECNVSYENNTEDSTTTNIRDLKEMRIIKKNYSKKKTLTIFQRIKKVKRSKIFLNPINLMKKQIFKKS